MNYDYESLGPERFQLFCQSLLNSEFPRSQFYPIGQPDGGRDAITYYKRNSSSDEFRVFQVKFVRKDDKLTTEWLEDILKKEHKKINALIKKGAKEYFILTNLTGTSHLDSGTIDKVNQILKKYIYIPSYCWWRNDLNIKLDVNWDLKWIYPELFSTNDLLRIIIENRLSSDNRERRFNAINSYIADQFDTESKVKFKQIELQNNLLDLFIDVPISPKSQGNISHKQNHLFNLLSRIGPDIKHLKDLGYNIKSNLERYYEDEEGFVGASTFFLSELIQQYSCPIVLEGGPGQGKSTITQYICQVHRSRLLNKVEELKKIPTHHLKSPIRLPIKIDLRDFASWVSNTNPFKISGENENLQTKNKSLDSFIAAHIEHYSDIEFDVNDLHELLKISKLLLVLDGFDEVADINLRQEIVNVITKGIRRIKTFSADIQVIITSRPAAFINSPSFSKDEYEYYFLDSVNSGLIEIYSDKWIKSKQLSNKEGAEIKKILKEKLTQPHIKDLAKNPMQLAILISLIHTKGYSLPDKRAAFYDSYIEVFFNRESEKDATVRTYRDLIIELHQYIAWIIHRDAELGSNGRIRQDKLVELLENYLLNEEHDTTIARRLFDKMAERVVALVSRIEGTFEFEVQPLREYFCAKYLYSTAPYSPTGKEKNGTKPDRFDAMAKNFYWLNVLRFYCGCFDKGELPTIIDRLIELTEDENYQYISHPRELSAILLSDWIFAQYPKLMKEVVKILLNGLGLRTLLSSDMGYSYRSSEISLPHNSGRDEIVNECFSLLKTYPPKDYSLELINIILSNDNGKIQEIWEKEIINKKGNSLINWITYGLYLRIIHRLEDSKLLSLFEDKKNLSKKVFILIQAGKGVFVESIPDIAEKISENALNGSTENSPTSKLDCFISFFWRTLDPNLFFSIINNSENIPCLKLLNRHFYFESYKEDLNFPKTPFLNNLNTSKYQTFLSLMFKELSKTSKYWNQSFEPWEIIIEKGSSIFGERCAFYNIVSIGASIKIDPDGISDLDSLFDQEKPLIKRARFARLKSKNMTWWKTQFNNIQTTNNAYFYLIMIITWASTSTISKLINQISQCIEKLNDEEFYTLYLNLKKICNINMQNAHYKNYENIDITHYRLNTKLLKILAIKLKGKNLIDFRDHYLKDYNGSDIDIFSMLEETALDGIINAKDIEKNLMIVKNCYTNGILSERRIYEFEIMRQHYGESKLDPKYAKLILTEPSHYPRFLVQIAESSFKNQILKNIKSVKDIATEENWFN